MPLVTYRILGPGLPPRPTQMPVPGWGGDAKPRADGSHQQPWHCQPFSEGAKYGIEILYPFEQELRVRTLDGKVSLEADWGPDPENGMNWPPFRPFGDEFYSYQIALDLKCPPGWGVRMDAHPRYFVDLSNETPLAVPAMLRTEWWPMIFFIIFKAPPPGVTHVFRHGEPFVQAMILPVEAEIALEPMSEEEAAERELMARRMHEARDTLSAGTRWVSDSNTVFDGTYRHLSRAAKARDPQT